MASLLKLSNCTGLFLEREPKIFKHLKKSYLLIGAFDQLALLFTLKSLSHA